MDTPSPKPKPIHTILEFTKSYGPAFSIWLILLSLLGLPKYSIVFSLLQSLFILFWSYAGHVIAHTISSIFPFNYINPHVSIHHNHTLELPRWLNLSSEVFTNFLGFYILYIIQYICNITILSTSIIIGGAFIYIAIHIFNYSMYTNLEHSLHHKNTFCNYGPDFMDVLFNTRCNPDDPYQNMNPDILYGVGGVALAACVKYILELD